MSENENKKAVANDGTRSLLPGRNPGERRYVTAVFCDLEGSTTLSEQVDPEDLRDIMRDYQDRCARSIERFGGYVSKYLGDGVMAYFGYPIAHEDNAQRAVRAGLQILDEIRELNIRLQKRYQRRLAVRIGIDTGLVVAGDAGSEAAPDPLAIVGETPNIAARLQSLAEPNSVMISADTQKLVRGLFVFKHLGEQTLKGLSRKIESYQVLRESGAWSRFDVALSTGLTPLVNRDAELMALIDRWEQVQRGSGHVMMLSGEPGIGKSRLVKVFEDRLAASTNVRLECHCSPYFQNSALYPFIDLLSRLTGSEANDPAEDRLARLEQTLGGLDLDLSEVVPLLAALLSINTGDRYPPLRMEPAEQRKRTHQAIVSWLSSMAESTPVMLVVEDLHWIDPSTMELLQLLIGQSAKSRMMLLLTFRPVFAPPWRDDGQISHVHLGRLPAKETERLIDRVTGGKRLPEPVFKQLVNNADGVPLFVEESTKMVIESGLLREGASGYDLTGPLPTLTVPETLRDSLMARLDRLGPVKEVAQLCSALGRSFSLRLVSLVSGMERTALDSALQKLVEAGLLYEQDPEPERSFFFKHNLIQEAAYQSLLKKTRAEYHARIATALRDGFPNIAEGQPEVLAYHFTQAGLVDEAVSYWQKAGDQATQRSAFVEAVRDLEQGLEVVERLDDTKRDRIELQLLITLGIALTATKGYSAPEVEHNYRRALELCERSGEKAMMFPILFGLWRNYVARADFIKTRELADRLLPLAEAQTEPTLVLTANGIMGLTRFFLGELEEAQEHFDVVGKLYEPGKHGHLAARFGQDPGLTCMIWSSLVLWLMGFPDQAEKRNREALDLAYRQDHLFSLAYTLRVSAAVHHMLRQSDAVESRTEEVSRICSKHGMEYLLYISRMLQSWAIAEGGDAQAALSQMIDGLEGYKRLEVGLNYPYFISTLADLYRKAGRYDEGLAALNDALNVIESSGERWFLAEVLRLKGELSLAAAGGDPAAAEALFRQAREVAVEQQARSLELRAVVSLARLWASQGRGAEARRAVGECLNEFTEGYDTSDLRQARELLDTVAV